MKIDVAWRKAAITGLLSGQRSDGGFGVHPYSKWTGAHWRLVSLVELGIARTNRAAKSAAATVLAWLASDRWRKPMIIEGLERRHASMEGNALAVCCRLGMAKDPRVQALAEVLLRAQWPDGGWNCDRDPKAHRSSFHESLAPIWGLHEYAVANGDEGARKAARAGAELLLEHRLFRSLQSGTVIDSEWKHIHWPHYWHYDYFNGLRMVARLSLLSDPRASDARELLLGARRADGTWCVSGRRYWRPATEAVNWGDARQIVTPYALALVS